MRKQLLNVLFLVALVLNVILVIYANHTVWNWLFKPHNCPINPDLTSLSEEDQLNPHP